MIFLTVSIVPYSILRSKGIMVATFCVFSAFAAKSSDLYNNLRPESILPCYVNGIISKVVETLSSLPKGASAPERHFV
jgi:hypothetical protein